MEVEFDQIIFDTKKDKSEKSYSCTNQKKNSVDWLLTGDEVLLVTGNT